MNKRTLIGMDFGTTNTGAAAYDGRAVTLYGLDPAAPNPAICRTSVYMTRDGDYHLGSQGLNLYFQQNLGRPSRYKKIKVGEILQIFAELPPFYREVFVYEDEFSPGRLFTSIKTALRNPNYFGTVFQGHWYSVSDLAAIFLMGMKLRIDRQLATEVNEVVLGRPVHFSTDPDEDKVAQSRLLDAAFKAGFQRVYLEYEPVAAALSYERTLADKEVILVFDFGGGTLDFTVMEVGGRGHRQVLATGGIPIAGDVFDQRLFRDSIPKHLGEGDEFISQGRRYPIPAFIFDQLANPLEVVGLNTPKNLEMLRSIHQGALHKRKTRTLMHVVQSNYALLLIDLVEKAKRELSSQMETNLVAETEDFLFEETMRRARFEVVIHQEYERIRAELLATLERSGLKPEEIQRVIRTGGSSQIPLFVRLLEELFGADKVRQIDVFSSVTSGLAIRGYEISEGLPNTSDEWTPERVKKSEGLVSGDGKQTDVEEIDLGQVGHKLVVSEQVAAGTTAAPAHLVLVIGAGGLSVLPAREVELLLRGALGGSVQLRPEPGLATALRATFAAVEDRLLLGTSLLKLINVSAKALYVATQAGPTGISDLLRLEPGEEVTAAARWDPNMQDQGWVSMLTHYGQARSFDARLLAGHLSKSQSFQLERRYAGVPVALAYLEPGERLAAGTSLGRLVRLDPAASSIFAINAIKLRAGEEISTCAAESNAEGLVALSEAGLAVAVPPGEAGKESTVRRNFHMIALFPKTAGSAVLLTSHSRLVRLELPGQEKLRQANSPLKVARLNPGERVVTVRPQ